MLTPRVVPISEFRTNLAFYCGLVASIRTSSHTQSAANATPKISRAAEAHLALYREIVSGNKASAQGEIPPPPPVPLSPLPPPSGV